MQKVQVQEQSFAQWLAQLPNHQKLILSLIASVLIAYYIPLIVASLFGQMVNSFTDWIYLSVSLTISILTGVAGYKTGKIWIAYGTVAALIFAYSVSLFVRMSDATGFLDWLWRAIMPVATLLINAAVLSLMKKRLQIV